MEKVVLLFVFVVFGPISSSSSTSPVPTQAPEPIQQDLPGPCRAWQLPCGHSWTCTSEQEYQRFRLGPQPGCPDIMPVNATQPPAPGRCEIVDGTCQFTTYLLQCTSWVNTCQIRYQCGSIEEHAAYLNSSESHCGLFQPLPKPNSLCLPINNTCQWYNPCASWRGHCLSGYNCGTADEYYAFLYGPHPLCAQPPPGWTEPLPPGECQLDSSAQCSWSNCTSWLGRCQFSWYCDTEYQKQVYLAQPPPPCPPPPPDYTPPPPPGDCKYDLLVDQCHFEPVTSTTTAEPPTCSDGKEYRECGPICPETCDTVNGFSPCFSLRCGSPGCYCPAGTVLHQGRCIDPSQCPTENPCALIDCLPHYTCQVDPSTGDGVCVSSCDVDNGGCPSNEVCVVKEYGIKCFKPPHVSCSSEDVVDECPANSRCLVQNVTKEVSCVPSCFINNGGCSDDVCVNHISTSDCNYPRELCTTDARCFQLSQLSRKCPAGMEYSECGSYCEPSCDTLLSQETFACAGVCVSGCFCPRGLVTYRDRCVDPKECFSLFQDPPPPNPLPIKATAVLISMSVGSIGMDEFDELQQPLLDAIADLLENKGYSVEVEIHAVYMESQDQLIVAFEVSGNGVSTKNADTLAALISSNVDVLPVEVRSVSIVPTPVQPEGIVLSTGAIVGIVIGALVVILAVFVIVAVSIVVIVQKKKHPNNVSREMNAKETPVSYSKLEFEHEDTETIPPIAEPLPEKPTT